MELSFNFTCREIQLQQKQEEKYLEELPLFVKSFEKQFESKSIMELRIIAKEDSPYTNYARHAAKNLLKMKEPNE